jgi:hypothetical protein
MKTSMRFSNLQPIALAALLLLAAVCTAPATPTNSQPVLASFELRDQYDIARKISFPATNVTVVTVADRKGSEQIDGWIAPLKERYGGRIDIQGVADMSKVPGLLRSMVREQFKKRRTYPVMLDWDGRVARGFNYHKDEANVFVIDRDGRITGHFTGAANEIVLSALFGAVDRALSKPPQSNSLPVCN